jgi:uncharacterized protein YukE
MNNDDIKKLDTCITKLKTIRKNLDSIFADQISTTNSMKSAWEGNAGIKAFNTISKHNSKYDDFLISLDKNINELEKVRNKY